MPDTHLPGTHPHLPGLLQRVTNAMRRVITDRDGQDAMETAAVFIQRCIKLGATRDQLRAAIDAGVPAANIH